MMRIEKVALSLLLGLCLGPSLFPQAPGRGSLRVFPVADIEIACQDFGQGQPTLVMVMGYGGGMDFWSPRLLQLLGESYRVIIFDNRGMGRSTSSDAEYSVARFAEDTLGVMDAFAVDQAVLVGWSLGTEIALELALRHPQRVSGLVLISGTPGGKEKVEPAPGVTEALLDSSGSSLQRGLRLIGLLFPPEWLITHPIITAYFPIHATMNPPERTRRQYDALAAWEGCASRLHGITAPALIIAGEADSVIPPSNSVLLAQGIRSSRLVRIPGGGHGLIFQEPDRIVDEVAAFRRQMMGR